MKRRDIVVLIGLFGMAACLDRKTKSVDGAAPEDAPTSEVAAPAIPVDGPAGDIHAPLEGAGLDGAPAGVDGIRPVDAVLADLPAETTTPDVPADTAIPSPDVPLDLATDIVVSPPDGPIDSAPSDTRDAAFEQSGDTTSLCTGACCADSDCPGNCQTCSASHTCVAVTNADDPNGRCAGTCDATGICKGKKGQACDTVAAGCVSGTTCSPENICCDKVCTGSCEACDTPGALGTCTTLGSGATPHIGHSSCIATSPECAGKCNGTSSACHYASGICGTASCIGSTLTPAGTCSNGACMPGTPQACPSNETCSGNVCACSLPYLTCSTTCLDPRSDPSNCGSCGRNCLGGTCGTGLCQPAVVVSGLGAFSSVFGVDASYLYYSNCTDAYTCDIDRVDKTVGNGTGSVLKSGLPPAFGVIGNTLFLSRNMQPAYLCTLGGICDPDNSSLWIPSSGMFGSFKSPSPQYYSKFDASGTSALISWYTTGNALVTSISITYQASGSDSFSAYGNSVYWTQDNVDGSGNPTGRVLYGTTGFPVATVGQLASVAANVVVVDVNAQSVILMNAATNNLYRVPLPDGLGTGSPQQIAGSTGTKAVTEDANGIHWIDSNGVLRKCSAPTCTNSMQLATNVAMANVGRGLFQDTTALYWVSSQGQLLRLAK